MPRLGWSRGVRVRMTTVLQFKVTECEGRGAGGVEFFFLKFDIFKRDESCDKGIRERCVNIYW